MPIYAYKCQSCGHAKDVLQKLSDPPLSVCPACGESAFSKQVTAAGFQLKGTGWYATDFRGGSGSKPADGAKHAKGAKPAEGSKTDAARKPPESTAPASKPDAPVACAGHRRRALARPGGVPRHR
jgi:putative FmdB family regulatory protein